MFATIGNAASEYLGTGEFSTSLRQQSQSRQSNGLTKTGKLTVWITLDVSLTPIVKPEEASTGGMYDNRQSP
jgi:hypothetical protein